MVVWAISEAEQHGYAIDKEFLSKTVESTIGSPEKLITSRLFNDPDAPPDPRPVGKGVKISAAFVAVAARTLPSLSEGQQQALSAIADEIVNKQRADGGWDFYLTRPPINESETTDAAWLILALRGETGPDSPEPRRAALAKAEAWWANVKLPDNLQDKSFKVLLATRAGKSRDELQSTLDEILALQQPDGGWRQNADMPTDAFATGQTLYALSLAGYTAEDPAIARAIAFLVARQQTDGSWTMTSRASNDGSPGGSSKLLTPITCAASSWAVLGLSRLAPKQP